MGRFSAADHPRDPAGRWTHKNTPADRGNLADLASQTEPAAVVLPEDPAERAALAADDGTPPEALAVLAADDDSDVLEGVAGNPNTPPGTLTVLAEDPHWGVPRLLPGFTETTRPARVCGGGGPGWGRRRVAWGGLRLVAGLAGAGRMCRGWLYGRAEAAAVAAAGSADPAVRPG